MFLFDGNDTLFVNQIDSILRNANSGVAKEVLIVIEYKQRNIRIRIPSDKGIIFGVEWIIPFVCCQIQLEKALILPFLSLHFVAETVALLRVSEIVSPVRGYDNTTRWPEPID